MNWYRGEGERREEEREGSRREGRRRCIYIVYIMCVCGGGAGRSSGSWSADPQGPGITGHI